MLCRYKHIHPNSGAVSHPETTQVNFSRGAEANMSVEDRIKETVSSNRVVLFMKGTPQFPQCGFSSRAVQILEACGTRYETVNVLSDMEVREGIKHYSNWPTIPQVYIDGEFVGGSDILLSMYQNGELQSKLNTTD